VLIHLLSLLFLLNLFESIFGPFTRDHDLPVYVRLGHNSPVGDLLWHVLLDTWDVITGTVGSAPDVTLQFQLANWILLMT